MQLLFFLSDDAIFTDYTIYWLSNKLPFEKKKKKKNKDKSD